MADKGGLWAEGHVSPPVHQQEVGRHPDGGSFIDGASYQEAGWAKRPRGWDGAGLGPHECGEWQAGLDGVGVQGGNAVADEDGPWAEACINPLVHQQGVGSHPHGSSPSDGASYQVTHELSAMMLPERTLCHRVDWGVVQNDTKDGLMAGPAPRAVGTKEHQNRPMVPRGGVMSKSQNGRKQRADLGALLPEPMGVPASNPLHGTVDRVVHCGTRPGWAQGFKTHCRSFFVFCQFCMQEARWAKRPRGWDNGSEAGAGSQGSDPATDEDVPGLLEDSESDCESGEDTEGGDQEPDEEELADYLLTHEWPQVAWLDHGGVMLWWVEWRRVGGPGGWGPWPCSPSAWPLGPTRLGGVRR